MKQTETTSNGIEFTEDIVSWKGASFILFPEDHHTEQDVKNAKAELRNQRDVVSIHVATEDDRDYLYKGEIFRHPATRPLKWYQVETDEKLMRKERKKGTTPEQYVNTFVLPFIKENEKRMLERSGEKIYQI